ncbi:MAG: hypothetical protein ACI9G1_000479, partial [Pirellulaceae bacterium]
NRITLGEILFVTLLVGEKIKQRFSLSTRRTPALLFTNNP